MSKVEFEVGDRCIVVDSIHNKHNGQVVVIKKIQNCYHYADCLDTPNYPFYPKELKLYPLTKLEKAVK